MVEVMEEHKILQALLELLTEVVAVEVEMLMLHLMVVLAVQA